MRVPLKDVFWRSLITAAMLPIAIGIANGAQSPRNDPNHALRVATEQSAMPVYQVDKWWVNGRMVMLDCPTEDSCQAQWTGEHWWIYKVVP
jgi:hypothetical protein